MAPRMNPFPPQAQARCTMTPHAAPGLNTARHARALDHVQALSARVFGPTRLRTENDFPDVRLQVCRIGPLTLATTRYDHAMEVEPQPGKDEYVIQTVLSGRCRVEVDGAMVEMTPGDTWVFSPSLAVRLHLDADCERFSVVVRRQTLEEAFRASFHFDAPAPLVFPLQPVSDTQLSARWHAMMTWLRAEAAMRVDRPGPPAADVAIGQIVLSSLLIDHFGKDGSLLPRGYLPTLPGYVRCAIRYLRENLDKPVTLQALAEHCGVCERTLQLGFRKSKDVTPMEYLRLLRLQGARTALQRAMPTPGVVATIAARHGFTHLSLFSREYRKAFGELPSATLRGR
ncbi:AraC family transcriptional regulator [Cupriavidus sp. 2SB]|uniref:AraC family transcriptional regulator n=1 Tax=Cupriavidus sp. 2SB TaxID=2502199 RepID=UPI002016AE7B|nr:AraC family transcriptional regulator [Cupriavidus sp. 2SB]